MKEVETMNSKKQTATHTPGPWHLDTASDGSMAIIPETGFTICPLNPRKGFESDVPNFRIMASAPKLLEALEFLIYTVEHECQPHGRMVDGIANARSEIAKARGKRI